MTEVEGGDGGEKEVEDKTDFFFKNKIKNYGNQLDSDMWQKRREIPYRIFLLLQPITNRSGLKREDIPQSWVYF